MIEIIDKDKDFDFFEKVYQVVARIPIGNVTTYGAISKFLGIKSSARMVGWALNSAANRIDLPCHRVVNRNGELTGKRYFATPNLMKELLLAEGIEFIDNTVNMEKHFWEPK
jgi:methylated-DNA-protein-cysteine methyltransferase-like protein